MNQRFRAFVRGDVQGVSFRWYVAREAARLGIRGWVRNRFDGSVEVLAEGDRSSLEDMIRLLHRGPRLARVEDVEIGWEAVDEPFRDFRIERSA